MKALVQRLVLFFEQEEGVTAIEYGLIASLVAVAFIAGATALGGKLEALFQGIAGKMTAP